MLFTLSYEYEKISCLISIFIVLCYIERIPTRVDAVRSNDVSSREDKVQEDEAAYEISSSETKDNQQLKIFQSLFKKKRVEYKDAIKSIMQYDSVKQYKLIETILTKALQVLEDSQVKLREGGYVPGMKFPEDERVRDALSLCLENTVFLSELILHFPDITQRVIKLQNSWNLILTWGIFFASQSNFLDKKTKELIYLVSQELSLAEKDPDYVNPYVTYKKALQSSYEQETKRKKNKKKKSFKHGPMLSRNIGEL